MYKIRLPNFEGPFDLLLYFIKREEVNIYDIPIARITEEFLNYIRLMQIFDLELAGEFLVMAASLMYVKIQMLIPRETDSNDEAVQEDPRTDLVQRILEYKQFKESSYELSALANDHRYIYYRKMFEGDKNVAAGSAGLSNVTLFDLLRALKTALDRNLKQDPSHIVQLEPVSVEEMRDKIMAMLNHKKRINFFAIMSNARREVIVATFLALLELIRMRSIIIRQDDVFEDIEIGLSPAVN